jgi:hypothetical protein
MDRPRQRFAPRFLFTARCCAAVVVCLAIGGTGLAALGTAGAITNAATGTYVIKIAGYYTGTGQASVGTGVVHITGNVQDSSGNKGTIRADIQFSSTHFEGTGTVLQDPMTVEGRVDSADQKRGVRNQVQVGPRIVATFISSAGHRGRIFGQPNHSIQPN